MIKVSVIGSRGIHFQYSGIENALKELLPRIEAKGEVKFIVYGYDTEDLLKPFEGIDHVLIPSIFSKIGGNAVASLYSFMHSIFWVRPNCYMFFASGPSIYSIVTNLFQIPAISAIRAIDSQRTKWNSIQRFILRMGERIAFKYASATTVNSEHMVDYFSKYEPIYIPNGYSPCNTGNDTTIHEFGLEPDNYILFAARLVPEKRCDILIEAFTKFKNRVNKDIKLVIAGGYSSSSRYLEKLHSLSTEDVIFVGHLSKEQLNPIMRNSTIFIQPSVLEGMSNSLLSAMSEKVCCLCTDIPENRAIITSDEVYFQVDDINQLSNKIEFYLSNEVARESLATLLNDHVRRNYSWEDSAESYRQLILSLN